MMINGCSTGWPPIQVKISRLATNTQYRIWVIGRNIRLRCFEVWRKGINAKIKMDRISARTPPSLLGMERRIAYAKRKYHSGLMWGGVLSGFAGI